MSSSADPTDRDGSVGPSERAAAIKFWTRQILALPEDSIVSVSEFACGKPTCPNQHTAIVVMSQEGPTQKISIHKRIADISEFDVLEAYSDSLQASPS
jgi:hypothetical protein